MISLEFQARVTLSPVLKTDFEDLLAIRIEAMRESLERVGRFDLARARERLRKSFYPESSRYILLDNQKTGFYTFRVGDEECYLDHLYIKPEFQSKGVGSAIIERLTAIAREKDLPIVVGALKESGSNRFYTKRGFIKTDESEWDIDYIYPSPRMKRAAQ